jgi:hypothetical protein
MICMTEIMIRSILQKFLGDRTRLGRILIQSYRRLRVIKEESRVARNRERRLTENRSDRPSINTMEMRLRMPHVAPGEKFCSERRVPPLVVTKTVMSRRSASARSGRSGESGLTLMAVAPFHGSMSRSRAAATSAPAKFGIRPSGGNGKRATPSPLSLNHRSR